jgi:hypothetical protein
MPPYLRLVVRRLKLVSVSFDMGWSSNQQQSNNEIHLSYDVLKKQIGMKYSDSSIVNQIMVILSAPKCWCAVGHLMSVKCSPRTILGSISVAIIPHYRQGLQLGKRGGDKRTHIDIHICGVNFQFSSLHLPSISANTTWKTVHKWCNNQPIYYW